MLVATPARAAINVAPSEELCATSDRTDDTRGALFSFTSADTLCPAIPSRDLSRRRRLWEVMPPMTHGGSQDGPSAWAMRPLVCR